MGGCLSSTGARSTHQEVIPTSITHSNHQEYGKQKNRTGKDPVDSGLAVVTQQLKFVQNASPVKKQKYFLDSTYDSGQRKLLCDSARTLQTIWRQMVHAGECKDPSDNFNTVLQEAIVNSLKNSRTMLHSAEAVDRTLKPLQKAYAVLENTNLLYKNNIHSLLAKAKHHPETGHLLSEQVFYPNYTLSFNEICLDIAAGTLGPGVSSTDELAFFLDALANDYAARGVVKNQLKNVKGKLATSKTQNTLDKNFIVLLEEIVRITEVALKNMEQPAMKAILEELAVKARPQIYRDIGSLKNYTKTFDLPETVLNSYYDRLKAIQLALD